MKHLTRWMAAVLLVGSFSANAQFTGSVGASYADVSGADLAIFDATLGWKFRLNESISIQPEMRGGIGINEENASALGQDIRAEVNNTFGFNVRLQADLQNDFYLFLQPTYTRTEFKFASAGVKSTPKDWDFGGGGGFGFMLNPNFGLEAGYERLDGDDVWRGAVRFYF